MPGRPELLVCPLRTAAVLLRCGRTTVLTDPFFSRRMGGLRTLRPPALEPAAIGPVDLLLLSHLHRDHFDGRAARALVGAATTLVGPPGSRELCRREGLERVVELGPGRGATVRGVALTAFAARHTGPPPAEVNYLLSLHGWRVFFGGDAALSEHHERIATRVPELDLALLPVGGTRIWLGRTTMSPADAVAACRLLRPALALGIHEGGEWPSLPPLSWHPGRRERFDALLAAADFGTEPIPAAPGQAARLRDAPAGPTCEIEPTSLLGPAGGELRGA